jgi:integrase/recombinase XerD
MSDLTISPYSVAAVNAQVDSDDGLISLWLGVKRSDHTKEGYSHDFEAFRSFTASKPLLSLTVGDVLAYSDSLSDFAPTTHARKLSVV